MLKLRQEASKRDLELRRLRHENSELRKLVGDDLTVTSFDECGFEKEVASMKAFLADYGLVCRRPGAVSRRLIATSC